MYSPEDGLPNPTCKNCKFRGIYVRSCLCPYKGSAIYNGGTDCEAHEYREREDGYYDEDDRYEKGE